MDNVIRIRHTSKGTIIAMSPEMVAILAERSTEKQRLEALQGRKPHKVSLLEAVTDYLLENSC
jgi:hypothetical protein